MTDEGKPQAAWLTRSRLVVLACALLPALIAGSYGIWVWQVDRRDDPNVVSLRQWRTVADPGLNVWPTTGNRRSDRGLLRRATAGWRRPDSGQNGPEGQITVLFAGDIDDLRVVVMRDEGDEFLSTRGIARYVERKGRNREHRLASVRINDRDGYAPSVIGLVTTARGVRYLLPPWWTDIHVTDLSAASLQARPLAVRGGVTDPILVPHEPTDGPPCRRIIALQATQQRASGPLLETFVSAPGPGHPPIAYHPDVSMLPEGSHDQQQPITTADQWQAVKDVACRQEIPAMLSPTHINIWPVWHGRLHHGVEASAYVAEVSSNDRGRDTFAVFDIAGEQADEVAGAHYQRADTAGEGIAVVAARWRAPSGRWYYTAVGSQRVNRMQVVGQRVTVRDQTGRVLTMPAPPPDDEPPAVAVMAYDTNNHPVATALPTALP